METITNVASAAKEYVWPSGTNETSETSQSGREPVSGQTGSGTATEPYDAGNEAGQASGSAGPDAQPSTFGNDTVGTAKTGTGSGALDSEGSSGGTDNTFARDRGGPQSHNEGPHKISIANKLDPNVDSDGDGKPKSGPRDLETTTGISGSYATALPDSADQAIPSTETKSSITGTNNTTTDSLAEDFSKTKISGKEVTDTINESSNTITSDPDSSSAPNVIGSAPGLNSSTHNTSPPNTSGREPASSASTTGASTLDGANDRRGVDTVTQKTVIEDTLASGEISPTNTAKSSGGTGSTPGKPLQAVSDATPSGATPEQPHKLSMKEKIKGKLHIHKH